jgi:hypothetical protein
MCSNDFATVGAEIPIFCAVAGIETIRLRCMCWKTRRTEAAGAAQRFDLLLMFLKECKSTTAGNARAYDSTEATAVSNRCKHAGSWMLEKRRWGHCP